MLANPPEKCFSPRSCPQFGAKVKSTLNLAQSRADQVGFRNRNSCSANGRKSDAATRFCGDILRALLCSSFRSKREADRSSEKRRRQSGRLRLAGVGHLGCAQTRVSEKNLARAGTLARVRYQNDGQGGERIPQWKTRL